MKLIHKFYLNGKYIVLDINSGSVFSVDELTYKILDEYLESSKDEIIQLFNKEYDEQEIIETLEEINTLINEGVLFAEFPYDKLEYNNQNIIKAMCLHIAHDCNIRCKYCFASQGDFAGERLLMSKEVGIKSIDYLIKHSGNRKNLEIDFFGGEPLLNLDTVKEIVNYAKEQEKLYNKNFKFTITTNATMLNDDIMKYLNDTMDNIVLSIDGRKEVNDTMRYNINNEGTYDVILPKIKKMVNLRDGKDYYVRGTFTKYNLDFSKDVLHLADQGFWSVSVEPVVAKPEDSYAITEEDLPIIFKEYEKLSLEYLNRIDNNKEFNFFHFNVDLNQGPCIYKRMSGCGAGNDYVAVTPEGDIYPCHQFVGDTDFKLGSVFTDNIKNSIKEDFKKANLLHKDMCKDCWAKFYCGGGCHANAYNFNKDILIPYEVGCEMEKKRIECAIMINVSLQEK